MAGKIFFVKNVRRSLQPFVWGCLDARNFTGRDDGCKPPLASTHSANWMANIIRHNGLHRVVQLSPSPGRSFPCFFEGLLLDFKFPESERAAWGKTC